VSEKHVLCYIARHGSTELNQKNAFRGPIDAPLDKAGWRDANQLAYYFEPIDVACIISSDRKRTRATAGLIAERKEIEPTTNPNLRAWDVGDLGGKPKSDENEEIVDWHVANPDVPLPGGEALNEFKARVQPLLREAIKLALRCGTPVLLVAHSSVIHEVGTMIGGSHEYTLVEPGGVAAIYIQDGELDAEPVFKARPRAKSAELT
jgi:broad specificity phosphatase PhoE